MARIVILVFVAAFCWCCDDEKIQVSDNSYFPLAVGNTWEYVPVYQSGLSPLTVVVQGTENIDNKTYYVVIRSTVVNGSPVENTIFYRMDDNGYVFERQAETSVEINRFRLNTQDGDTWQMPVPQMDAYTVTTSVMDEVQLTPLLSVPDGKSFSYDVPQYVDEEHYITLAKGLGIVKQGSAWGFDMRLKKAVINGTEYNF